MLIFPSIYFYCKFFTKALLYFRGKCFSNGTRVTVCRQNFKSYGKIPEVEDMPTSQLIPLLLLKRTGCWFLFLLMSEFLPKRGNRVGQEGSRGNQHFTPVKCVYHVQKEVTHFGKLLTGIFFIQVKTDEQL